jgi:hypothetical protein
MHKRLFLFEVAMRPAPTMRVEVGGAVAHRPSELDVLLFDGAGRPVISHLRPQLMPGEVLCERMGQIPMIVLETPCPT